MSTTITHSVKVQVTIDIPALTDLLKYLRDRDQEQVQVDELAGQVDALTQGLKQSSDDLKKVEENT